MLNLGDPKQLAGWCAMLLAFFGCFRLSNLVPLSKSKFDHLKQLKRNDIVLDKGLVLVYYKWSKTNQNSSKVAWVPICTVNDDRFNLKIGKMVYQLLVGFFLSPSTIKMQFITLILILTCCI